MRAIFTFTKATWAFGLDFITLSKVSLDEGHDIGDCSDFAAYSRHIIKVAKHVVIIVLGNLVIFIPFAVDFGFFLTIKNTIYGSA